MTSDKYLLSLYQQDFLKTSSALILALFSVLGWSKNSYPFSKI